MSSRLRAALRTVGLVFAAVGVVSLPADLQKWSDILTGSFLSWALLVFGVLVFAAATLADRLRSYFGASSPYVRGRTLTIPELVRLNRGQSIMKSRTFDQCRFVGPAVFVLNGAVFGEGNVVNYVNQFEKSGIFWRFADNVNVVQGALFLEGCHFVGCTFDDIGFGVNDELEAELRRVLAIGGRVEPTTIDIAELSVTYGGDIVPKSDEPDV